MHVSLAHPNNVRPVQMSFLIDDDASISSYKCNATMWKICSLNFFRCQRFGPIGGSFQPNDSCERCENKNKWKKMSENNLFTHWKMAPIPNLRIHVLVSERVRLQYVFGFIGAINKSAETKIFHWKRLSNGQTKGKDAFADEEWESRQVFARSFAHVPLHSLSMYIYAYMIWYVCESVGARVYSSTSKKYRWIIIIIKNLHVTCIWYVVCMSMI